MNSIAEADTDRLSVPLESLALPPSPTPRPGDQVVWYREGNRTVGKYIGHGTGSVPIVLTQFDRQIRLNSFDCLRIQDPSHRVGPNWSHLGSECIFRPLAPEEDIFKNILKRKIPPGPTYMELIEEIWNRGYEVYIVGGTVRDILNGTPSHDIDIATTMPLTKFRFLLDSMFARQISVSDQNGYARLGGKGRYGDPFIDLKAFCYSESGTSDVLFGSDFNNDLGYRDFACNAIYYDAINNAIIDPSGYGISDAKNNTLRLICNSEVGTSISKGKIAIRYFKFRMRGMDAEKETIRLIDEHYIPCIGTIPASQRLSYVSGQILGKLPLSERSSAVDKLKSLVVELGHNELWDRCFSPIYNALLKGSKTHV